MHPDTEVRTSDIAGRGRFATAPIAAGAVVARPTKPVHESGTINHACDPNLGWTSDGGLETLRDVEAGEELVADYALSIVDPGFYLRCHCPSYRCRQMVEGTDWQIVPLQQRYAGHWAPEVQRLIDDATKSQD